MGPSRRPTRRLVPRQCATSCGTNRSGNTEESLMIQHLDHDPVSLPMDARPEDVYELVADVTRMPEFSPEILECTWLDGATGPAVGARFKARNKVGNRPSWSNNPVVTVVEPGRT